MSEASPAGAAPADARTPDPDPSGSHTDGPASLTDARIGEALDRAVRGVERRRSIGRGTATTVARLKAGLACEIREGDWTLTAGMVESYGGTSEGPTPGVFGRAALASCLTIGYAMWAARRGVPLTSLEVEVQADMDAAGELGIDDDVPPGYLQVRYTVTVESPAPDEQVRALLEEADRYSSYRDIFSRAIDLRRAIVVRRASSP